MPSVFHEPRPRRGLLRSPLFWVVVIAGLLSVWALLWGVQPEKLMTWEQFKSAQAAANP